MASGDRVEGLAAIILAHQAPTQVHRLIDAMHGADVFVHCDSKTAEPIASAMNRGVRSRNATPLDRRDVRISSWSLVKLELDALRVALDQSAAPHIAVMSGADYPIVNRDVLSEALASWADATWMRSVALPYPPWNSRFSQDGGLWRWRWYFPTFHDNVIGRNALVLTVPRRRRPPVGLELRSSPHWKIYSRRDAKRLLEILDDNPQLVNFGRHTFIPEESFIPSVLASYRYMKDRAMQVRDDGPWYVNWPSGAPAGQHPQVIKDLDMARVAARASGGRSPGAPWTKPIFARKFPDSTVTYDLVEEVVWPATAR